MKDFKFLKKYTKFKENFDFNDGETEMAPAVDQNPLDMTQTEEEETETEENLSCVDQIADAVNHIDSLLQSCVADDSSSEEGHEMEPEHNQEREMEIYGRMREVVVDLKGMLSELRGDVAEEEESSMDTDQEEEESEENI